MKCHRAISVERTGTRDRVQHVEWHGKRAWEMICQCVCTLGEEGGGPVRRLWQTMQQSHQLSQIVVAVYSRRLYVIDSVH